MKLLRVRLFFIIPAIFCLLCLPLFCGCTTNNQQSLTYSVDNSLTENAIKNTATADKDKAMNTVVSNGDTAVQMMKDIASKKSIDIRETGAMAHSEFSINPNTYKKSDVDADTESQLAQINTKAIYAAICKISDGGGGTVIVPKVDNQVFYTSAIHMEDNVVLYLEEGATLKFTTDYSLYEGELMKEVYGNGVDEYGLTLTRFEGVELMNYSPFIYAYGKKNICIAGSGTLDGQASTGNGVNPETMTWHQWKNKNTYSNGKTIEAQDASRANLYKMGQTNVDVVDRKFGTASGDETSGADDGFLRPNFIQPYNCQNVVIRDVQIKNSPMWEINPVLCDTVVVQNTNINSHLHNNDGCDPECSSNVVIRNNTFDVGDDCIAIKSGRNGDGQRVNRLCYNIVVTDNTFKDGHGGITIGSEITAGVSNVFSDNNKMDSNQLEAAYRFKTNYIRGGKIKNIYYANDTVKKVKADKPVVLVDLNYDIENEVKWMERLDVEYCASIPSFAEVYIDNMLLNQDDIDGYGGKTIFDIKGFSKDSIAQSCKVTSDISDCYVGGLHVSNSKFIDSKQAFNCKYVDGFIFENVTISETCDKDSLDDCKNFEFKNCDFSNSNISWDQLNKVKKPE